MKGIDLVKLKELVARLLNPTDRFSEVSDKFEWKAVASPAVISALIEQLEAAQRERDEAVLLRIEVSGALSSETIRREKAEAELKRRDAQEPVAWRLINAPEAAVSVTDNGKMAAVWRKNGRIIEPLVVHAPPYAAAPAAVPEKVVKLPKLCVGVVQSGHAVMVPYKGGHWFNKTAIQEALDAAGVKWVEGE